jgi:predicted Zn-dependent peptidase
LQSYNLSICMQLYFHTLKNGIRLVHQQIVSPVSHLGVILNTGSRDEEINEQGIAHFIEHVIFKGTKKRKAYHIISRIEDVGGELNAYTTKEETSVYAIFLNEYFERSMELISDILINSTFPQKELEKEKEVVIEEINSYKDSPSDLIFDEFEEVLFDGHPIARNILGTPENVKSFSRENIFDFICRNYHTDQMVLSSVGSLPFDKIIRLTEKYFGQIPEKIRSNKRLGFDHYQASKRIVQKDTFQTHCIIGNIAYDHQNPRRIGMVLLNNILGGQSMNSRLNLALRERNGLAYNIESNYTAYSDTGQFSIYFGTDKENLDRAISLVQKEIKQLKNKELGLQQLIKAKKQLIGQLAISNENREDLMLSIGKSYLLYDHVDNLQQVYEKINRLTSREIQEISNEIFEESQTSILIYH